MARVVDTGAEARLLTASEEIFVEHGLDRARVEDITARAGLSKGSFYLHFDSKEEAFRRLVESIIVRMATFVDSAIDEADDDDFASLEAHFERSLQKEAALFEFLWVHRACMRLLLEGGRSPSFTHLMDEFADSARRRVVRSLRWGIERGIYRADLDVELASLYVAGAYDRLARFVVRQTEPPPYLDLVRNLQKMVLGGLANRHVVDELDGREPMPSHVAFG